MTTNETCSHCDGTGMVPELYGQPCGCQDTPMTTNDATPREAIARAMTSDFSQKVWDGEFNPSPDLDYNRAVREHVRNDFLADADAVIAHLWQAADDPAVVEAVAKANYQEDWQGMLEWEDEQGSPDVREWIEEASKWTRLVLTALLGPRPQESNDDRTNT